MGLQITPAGKEVAMKLNLLRGISTHLTVEMKSFFILHMYLHICVFEYGLSMSYGTL